MKTRKPVAAFTPQEMKFFTDPLTLASVLFMAIIILDGILASPEPRVWMIAYGFVGALYVLIYRFWVSRLAFFSNGHMWFNAALSGVGLGLLWFILPPDLGELPHILVVFVTIGIAETSGRMYAYVTLWLVMAVSLFKVIPGLGPLQTTLEYFAPFIVSVIAMETYIRVKHTTRQHIHRLETINKISRQMMQTLETNQVLSLLNAAVLEALEADTYYIGLVEGNDICLDLFYDDGEYFNETKVPLEGTLSGWVIKNQKDLFLPDLRDDIQLEGVNTTLIGKNKDSLSWIGVPLKSANITGIMALASYKPNAFDLADLELLSSLAQHVTLALDNTIQHARVEEQAQLDSLTGVYNHGYFLERLREQAQEASNDKSTLGLIMLDIDYFKQYNDTYGHLVGDQILTALCTAIKKHIKHGDAVGRWGGEEFVISLPNTKGDQALQVANRISETMATLRVENLEQKTVPMPTMSQGIAVYPDEANEIYRLIDLADQRLYVAKERGRNQIEPEADHWPEIQMEEC